MRGDIMTEEANVPELLAQHALRILQASPYRELRQLRCDFEDGKLIIRGHVTSFYAKQMAQAAVQSVDGVNGVINEVTVQ